MRVNKIELYEHGNNEGGISSRSRSELSNNNYSDKGEYEQVKKAVQTIFNTDCSIRGIDNKGISQQLISNFNHNGHCDRDKMVYGNKDLKGINKNNYRMLSSHKIELFTSVFKNEVHEI